jgi:hypothetical protein
MPTINGTPGPDTLNGTSGDDIINGLAGNDSLDGLAGNDIINGGDGDDTIVDHFGANTLNGDAGDDRFVVTYSATIMSTETSNIFGGIGRDTVRVSGEPRRLGDGSVRVTDGFHVAILHDVETLEQGGPSSLPVIFSLDRETKNDVNADNYSDLFFLSTSTNNFTAAINPHTPFDPSLSQTIAGGIAVSGPWSVRASGDVNSDGLMEFVVQNDLTGEMRLYDTNNSSAHLSGAVNAGLALQVRSIADIDGNLFDDLIWQNTTNGEILIQFRASALGNVYLPAIGADWKMVAAEDFDRDGDADILLRRDGDGLLYVWKMEDGAISGGINFGALGTQWIVDATGDFNNDGFGDIALKNTSTGLFYLFLLDGAGGHTGSNLGAIGTDWSIATVGDYNGDGTDDLVWRNANTNQIYLWTMDNGHQAATGSAPYGYVAADQIII